MAREGGKKERALERQEVAGAAAMLIDREARKCRQGARRNGDIATRSEKTSADGDGNSSLFCYRLFARGSWFTRLRKIYAKRDATEGPLCNRITKFCTD